MGDVEHGYVVQILLDHVQTQHNYANLVSPLIHTVPGALRDQSPRSFNPHVVSIGPLHRPDENVQAFERQKATYLSNLMNRVNFPKEEILNNCVEQVFHSIETIKACYENHAFQNYDNSDIVGMMIMDSCFMLEFTVQISPYGRKPDTRISLQYHLIALDLMLLENQIPFFILQLIFRCTIADVEPKFSLGDLLRPLVHFHKLVDSYTYKDKISNNNTSPHHILSLLHECYKPQEDIRRPFFGIRMPSAVELDRVGVNLKPNKNQTWLMGMEVTLSRFTCFFGSWRKPTLKMPVLVVNDFTESILRNLIAYEQSGVTGTYVSSYAYIMDMLVNAKEDVAKLVESGVLTNYLDSNEEVVKMISSIRKELVATEIFYDEGQLKALSTYSNGYMQKNIAWLKVTYFRSPWNMISLLAGIILFALTVVQTFYTIKSA